MSVGTLRSAARGPLVRLEQTRVREMIANPALLALASLTAIAAILRFARIGHQGFWFDEGNTVLLLHFSPGHMLGLLPQTESTPPLYYCIAWIWARIFGYGEAGLRSLSALVGVATVPVLYGSAAKLISRRAGFFAAALAAFNPFLIWYSQEARSYSLLVFLSAAALMTFAHARHSPTRRSLVAWVIVAALALTTHYYALLAVVPQALWLLYSHRRRRGVLVAVGVVALCGAALIPLAISQNGTGHASWIAPIALNQRLGQVIPNFLVGYQMPAQGLLVPLAGALVVVAVALLISFSEASERRGALIAGALALSGLILNLLLIAGGIDDLITRNVIALWVPAAVFVAGGLGARNARVLGALIGAALCAIGAVAAIGVVLNRSYQRPDWRGVARLLGSRPTPGSPGRAILIQEYHNFLPLSLYLPGITSMKRPGAVVSELDVVGMSAPRVHLCWWGAACNLGPSRVQSSYPLRGFHLVWRRQAFQFTVLHLVADRPRSLTPREVSRTLTATHPWNDELLLQR